MGPANEAVLHYVWKEKLFNTSNLVTRQGEQVIIKHSGFPNFDAGPDFREARIIIDGIEWNASVEIHIRSSEWFKHGHQNDPSYEHVALHVVWEDDRPVHRDDGSPISTLELKHRIDQKLFARYQGIMLNPFPIPCQDNLSTVDSIIKMDMIENAVVERLEDRFSQLSRLYSGTRQHWDAMTWQWIAGNFGFKINSAPFQALAASIPYTVLLKQNSELQMESLLFGQAGFLDTEFEIAHVNELRKEYLFQKKKYRLEKSLANTQWRFLRMRPGNFPTLRIAQLAALSLHQPRLHSKIISIGTYKEAKALFQNPPSEYWKDHYHFNRKTAVKSAQLGENSIRLLVLNGIVPLLHFYAHATDRPEFSERAMAILDSIPPEKNKKIRRWVEVGITPMSALESQGLIQLLDNYCLNKKCLNCKIGKNILRN